MTNHEYIKSLDVEMLAGLILTIKYSYSYKYSTDVEKWLEAEYSPKDEIWFDIAAMQRG